MVIPQALLDSFVHMVSSYDDADSEINRQCAHSFPAVAFTLGRNNWPCIMGTYKQLAVDMQVFFVSNRNHVWQLKQQCFQDLIYKILTAWCVNIWHIQVHSFNVTAFSIVICVYRVYRNIVSPVVAGRK